MLILLPFAALFCITLAAGLHNRDVSKREVLLQGWLYFSLTLVFITEALSVCKAINYTAVAVTWIICIFLISGYLYKQRIKLTALILDTRESVYSFSRQLTLIQKIILVTILILLCLTFIQGVAYPPNNRDSLTYHMARIPSWISHHHVSHFPTHIVRQLYQPPLAEFTIMHLCILNGTDYFANAVQLFYLLFGLIALTCIIKELGLSKRYQLTGIALAVSIPEVILQASSTQNDLVVASFILCSFYFMLHAMARPSAKNYIFFGLSVALALFTKGTAYMYVAPLVIIYGVDVLIKVLKQRKPGLLYKSVFAIAVIPLIINSGHYYRNYSLSKNILGVDKVESRLYANERMSAKLFLGNAIKNADLHMGLLGVPQITIYATKATRKIFNKANIPLEDPAVTIPGVAGLPGDPGWASAFGGLLATYEDYGANFFHFWIILLALLISTISFLRSKGNVQAKLLVLAVVLQVIAFVFYLKWQSLGTRLHTPIFLMSVPIICYAISVSNVVKKLVVILLPLLIFYAYIIVTFNFAKPFITYDATVCGFRITRPISIADNRYKKYFSLIKEPPAYNEYDKILKEIKRLHYKNIGFVSGYNDWEYPLFKDCYSQELNPVHLFVNNFSKTLYQADSDIDCIVSTNTNRPYINYKGKRYKNESRGNTMLYFYRL